MVTANFGVDRSTPECTTLYQIAARNAGYFSLIFENARIEKVLRYQQASAQASGQAAGSVMTVAFELAGQQFVARNGGPCFRFNEAISFVVNCEPQAEVNFHWERLSEGGDEQAQQCGWLKDRFGVSWQVVPTVLHELLGDPDPDKGRRVMQALLKMKKIDLATLPRVYAASWRPWRRWVQWPGPDARLEPRKPVCPVAF